MIQLTDLSLKFPLRSVKVESLGLFEGRKE